jgi:hypothetical protein
VEGVSTDQHHSQLPGERQRRVEEPASPLVLALIVRDLGQVVERCGSPVLISHLPSQRQALLVQARGPLVVALLARVQAQVVGHQRHARAIA